MSSSWSSTIPRAAGSPRGSPPMPNEAYAVVHHECAATSYSIAHEIGHIIGARHDRSLDQNGARSPTAMATSAPTSSGAR